MAVEEIVIAEEDKRGEEEAGIQGKIGGHGECEGRCSGAA